MSSILNASASGGLVSTGDTSANLELQSDGTTKFTVDSTGAYGTLVRSTAVVTTTGTSIDFTGIPSWAKRITLMLDGVGSTGSSIFQVRIGSTTFATTGYASSATSIGTGSVQVAYTTAFGMGQSIRNNTSVSSGILNLVNITGNTWAFFGEVATIGINYLEHGAGSVTLSGTLDRVRLTTVNGTDTFRVGTMNILIEG